LHTAENEAARHDSRLDPDSYIDSKAATRVVGLSHEYLRKLRCYGGGPRFSTFGRAVRYRVADLHSWAADRAAESTGQRDAERRA
jgi:hypothetical protein